MKTFIRLLAFSMAIAAAVAFAGDEHEDGDGGHGHAHEDAGDATIAVTQWTDRMELFMEYPVLAANQQGRFIIHLTFLDGFQPAREGGVSLFFAGADGQTYQFGTRELLREGIFTPTVDFHDAGAYEFTLVYHGDTFQEEFHIDGFVVHPSADELPEDTGGGDTGEIAFLKEQQWKLPFATEAAAVREVRRSVRAVGEVMPSPSAYAEIIAPVDGIVQMASRGQLALPGSTVKRGDALATIAPPAQGDGWVASRLAFEQARRDYERAQRLRDLDAISERELEVARNEFETRKARFESVASSGRVNTLTLTAPLSGRIIEWVVRPGRQVRAGDKLMAVVDPSVVWLKVNVFADDFRALGRPVGAFVRTGGASEGWSVPESDMRVLTTGGALDAKTRTIPVLLEINNEDGRFAINESAPVELYASDGDSAVAVSRGAVYEDEGLHVVFVQTGGETFEKRQVELGPYYADWVSIRAGIAAGERIVSRGGYHVKLASTSAEIGHGHAH